jgi:hypothetical protein
MAFDCTDGMNIVHRPSMPAAQKRTMKYLPILWLVFAAIPAQADDEERAEVYQVMLSCAAFHTIEATKVGEDSSAAQQAVAEDYAAAAITFADDGLQETVNRDLQTLLTDFKKKLDTGEPRAMAEQWTALESACRELYPMKDELVAKRKAESNGGSETR